MIYLYENQVGYDPAGLGFPSIDGCHAIVVQTGNGLFGLHSLGGSQQRTYQSKAEAFVQYMLSRHDGSFTKCMYSICFLSKRGYRTDGSEGWDVEMKAIANELGYSGKIRGFDLGKKISQGSAYVELLKDGDKVKIYYKRWSKMEETGPPPIGILPTDLKQITNRGGGWNVNFVVENTIPRAPVGIISTGSNKGNLHRIRSFQMNSFNV